MEGGCGGKVWRDGTEGVEKRDGVEGRCGEGE